MAAETNGARAASAIKEAKFQEQVQQKGMRLLDASYEFSDFIEASPYHPDIDFKKLVASQKLLAEALGVDKEDG